MTPLSSRIVAWARARRAASSISPALNRRADPQPVTAFFNDAAFEYSDKSEQTNCSTTAPVDPNCRNKWWPGTEFPDRQFRMTAGPVSTLKFSFKGSEITIDPHLESSGANASIQVNALPAETISFGTSGAKTPWSKDGLDETQLNTVTLTYLPGNSGTYFIAVKSFKYMTTSPPVTQSNNTQDNTTNKNDRTISIAAGLSGAFALLVVVLLFAIWWFRRRRNNSNRPVRRLDRPSYSQRIESQVSSFHGHGSSSHGHGTTSQGHGISSQGYGPSSHGHGTYTGVAMQEGPMYRSNNSASNLGHVGGHSHSNSLGVTLPASNTNSTSDLLRPQERGPFAHAHAPDRDPFVYVLDRDPFATPHPTPPPRAQSSPFAAQQSTPPPRAQHSPSLTPQPIASPRPQYSHYAYDADHEPAPIPAAQGGSLAIDVLPEPRPAPANRNGRRGNGGHSPTETHTSYESWTSSDFGPIPSPLFVNAPPVPAIPPHLRSTKPARPGSPSSDPERGAGPGDAEKRRLAIDADARPAVGGSLERPGPASRQSTQPPRYSTILD
ncbi:hypothetical protein BKA62DRAFT_409027 [Auriculariales sp. MPI-PUGE-AT-0066]|nr:hypothetical protein BKA62DRAFT_409027 [Auriculariales sp. MPI-PUGE-AT-0066]